MHLAVFDTREVAPAAQFERFYDHVASAIIRVRPELPAGSARRPFRARIVSLRGRGRACHLIRAPGHGIRRDREDIGESDPSQFHINLMLAGERRGVADDAAFEAGRGDVFAINTDRPFRLAPGSGRYRALKIVLPAPTPRGFWNRSPRPGAWRHHALREPFLFVGRQLAAAIEGNRLADAAALLDAAILIWHALASGTISAAVDDDSQGLYAAILAEIDRNLGDPDFDLSALAATLHLGRRRLQRILARRGASFSELLRERRLTRAHQYLITGRASVERIAEACGYTEPSAFYRAFRRRFGHPPGALRARCR